MPPAPRSWRSSRWRRCATSSGRPCPGSRSLDGTAEAIPLPGRLGRRRHRGPGLPLVRRAGGAGRDRPGAAPRAARWCWCGTRATAGSLGGRSWPAHPLGPARRVARPYDRTTKSTDRRSIAERAAARLRRRCERHDTPDRQPIDPDRSWPGLRRPPSSPPCPRPTRRVLADERAGPRSRRPRRPTDFELAVPAPSSSVPCATRVTPGGPARAPTDLDLAVGLAGAGSVRASAATCPGAAPGTRGRCWSRADAPADPGAPGSCPAATPSSSASRRRPPARRRRRATWSRSGPGLGYNRRAVNLHRCAVAVVDRPRRAPARRPRRAAGPARRRSLHGPGGAGLRLRGDVGVVDTNVARMLARLPAGDPRARPTPRPAADAAAPTGGPGRGTRASWTWGPGVPAPAPLRRLPRRRAVRVARSGPATARTPGPGPVGSPASRAPTARAGVAWSTPCATGPVAAADLAGGHGLARGRRAGPAGRRHPRGRRPGRGRRGWHLAPPLTGPGAV